MSYQIVKIDAKNRNHDLMLRNYGANKKHVQHASLFAPSPEHVLTVTVNGFFSLASVKAGTFDLFLTHLEMLPFEAPIRCAALNVTPSSVRVVYALGHDRALLVGNFSTGTVETLHQFTSRPSCIFCDGDFTVAGDSSGEVALWRHAASGGFQHQWTMRPQEAAVSSLLLSRHLVVSAAEDFVIVIQNVQGVRVARLPTQASSLSLFAFGASTHPNTHPLDLGVVTEAGTLTTWERQGSSATTQHQGSAGAGPKVVPMGEGDVWTPLSVQQLGFLPSLGATTNNSNFLAIGGSEGEISLYDASDSKGVTPLVGFRLDHQGTMEQQQQQQGAVSEDIQGIRTPVTSGDDQKPHQAKVLQCSVTNDSHLIVVTSNGDVWRWPLSDVLPKQHQQQKARGGATLEEEGQQQEEDEGEDGVVRPSSNPSSSDEPRPESQTPRPSEPQQQQQQQHQNQQQQPQHGQQQGDTPDVLNVENEDSAPFQFDDDAMGFEDDEEERDQQRRHLDLDLMPSLQREPSPEQVAHMMMAGTKVAAGEGDDEEVIYMAEEEDGMDGYSVATPLDAQTAYSRNSALHSASGRPPLRVGIASGAGTPGRSASQDLGDAPAVVPPSTMLQPPSAPRGAALRHQDTQNDQDEDAPEPSSTVPRPSESPSAHTRARHHVDPAGAGSRQLDLVDTPNVSVAGLQGGKRMDPRAVTEVLGRGVPTSPENQSAINQSVLGAVNQSLTTNMLEHSKAQLQQATFSPKEYKVAHEAEVTGLMFEHGITSPRYGRKEEVYSEEVLQLGGTSPRSGGVNSTVLLDRTNQLAEMTGDTLLNQTVLATQGKRKVDPQFLKQRALPEPRIDDHLCHDLLFGGGIAGYGGGASGLLGMSGAAVVSSIFLDEHVLEPAPPQQILLPLPMAPTPSVF